MRLDLVTSVTDTVVRARVGGRAASLESFAKAFDALRAREFRVVVATVGPVGNESRHSLLISTDRSHGNHAVASIMCPCEQAGRWVDAKSLRSLNGTLGKLLDVTFRTQASGRSLLSKELMACSTHYPHTHQLFSYLMNEYIAHRVAEEGTSPMLVRCRLNRAAGSPEGRRALAGRLDRFVRSQLNRSRCGRRAGEEA